MFCGSPVCAYLFNLIIIVSVILINVQCKYHHAGSELLYTHAKAANFLIKLLYKTLKFVRFLTKSSQLSCSLIGEILFLLRGDFTE